MKSLYYLVLFFLVASVQPLAAQLSYTVADLGSLYSVGSLNNSLANGINNSGRVVGQSQMPDVSYHAFVTAPNSPINPATDDLGTFGGSGSEAIGINDLGQIVGWARTPGGGSHAFLWMGGIINDIDPLGPLSVATAINNVGQVVGWLSTAGTVQQHAFRTAANRPINRATDDLGTLGHDSFAYAINDAGQVAGYSNTDSGYRAFRTAPNSPINPATDNLGTLGGPHSFGYDIDSAGRVVGGSTNASLQGRAFRTAPNSVINPATDDLGPLTVNVGLIDAAINSLGQVVGQSNHGAALFIHGTVYDLNTLIPPSSAFSNLYMAVDINDFGQIVGNGALRTGNVAHAFRLDPTAPTLVTFLLDLVASFNLSAGETNALNASLNAARNSLLAGNNISGRNQLNAFENKVNAQRGKTLTSEQADALLALADHTIQMLS
jgi:probable HAF family extracellular repeat protein